MQAMNVDKKLLWNYIVRQEKSTCSVYAVVRPRVANWSDIPPRGNAQIENVNIRRM